MSASLKENGNGTIVADKFQGMYTCNKVAKTVFHYHLYSG